MLTLVKMLNLRECKGIKDISILTSVETLNLSGCTGIKDIGNLRQLKSLTITNYIHGIHLLTKLEKIFISVKLSETKIMKEIKNYLQ